MFLEIIMTDENTLLLLDGIDESLNELGLMTVGQFRSDDTEEEKYRRGRAFFRNRGGNMTPLVLCERNGVLRWNIGHTPYGNTNTRRAGVGAGKIVKQYAFNHEGENQIASLVRKRENKALNEKEGLWKLKENSEKIFEFSEKFEVDETTDFSGKKILLFIHGTFSHCDTTIDQINRAGETSNKFGQKFLKDAHKKYHAILGYNHPTLSVSPLLNAFNLSALLRLPADRQPDQIDIICHSRGGVVARWFIEGFGVQNVKYKVIFVACPLGGTTLASPTHLRAGADLLANYANVLSHSKGLPIANEFFILGTIIAKISQFAFMGLSKSPIFDIATAVIPGLIGQARIGKNYELQTLHKVGAWENHQDRYYSITSNFEPPESDIWKFWKVFNDKSNYLMTIGDKAVDSLIFVNRKKGPKYIPNDVVVDTASMTELRCKSGNVPKVQIKHYYRFEPTNRVHHTNYFDQAQLYKQIRNWLKVP